MISGTAHVFSCGPNVIGVTIKGPINPSFFILVIIQDYINIEEIKAMFFSEVQI